MSRRLTLSVELDDDGHIAIRTPEHTGTASAWQMGAMVAAMNNAAKATLESARAGCPVEHRKHFEAGVEAANQEITPGSMKCSVHDPEPPKEP